MAIEKIRLADGTEINVEEWLHWPLFSTGIGQGDIGGNALGAGGQIRIFTYIVGDKIPTLGVVTPTPVAGIADTNQVVRGKINHDEGFIAFDMTYEPFALSRDPSFGEPGSTDITAVDPILSGTNLRRLQKDVLMELFVGAGITKPMASAPLAYYSQSCGAAAFSSGDGLLVSIAQGGGAPNISNLALDYGTGGPVTPNNQRRWNLPIKIDADRDTYVGLRTPGGQIVGLDQSWRLRVYMDGLKRRAVA